MLTQQENNIVKDNLSLEEVKIWIKKIEKLLSVENILENPRLLDMMDDNLTISITDFCMYFKLSKNIIYKEQNIIEELSGSKNYIFDESKREIQRRERGLRRIILFQEVHSTISLKDFLIDNELMEKVVDYDESNKDYIKVYFHSEDEALEVIKKIEKIKWEKGLEFRCQIKCESFKFNISNQMYQKDLHKDPHNISLKNEIYIVMDKENYTPRILEPDTYSFNYENKNNSSSNNRIYKKVSFGVKENQYNQDYISNSTKESSEENNMQKKLENNKRMFFQVYEKMKNNKKLQMPYLMRKYFNPNIMEKKGELIKENSSEGRKFKANYYSKSRKTSGNRRIVQF